MTDADTVYLSRGYHSTTFHHFADCRYLADNWREATQESVEPVYSCCTRCERRRAGKPGVGGGR